MQQYLKKTWKFTAKELHKWLRVQKYIILQTKLMSLTTITLPFGFNIHHSTQHKSLYTDDICDVKVQQSLYDVSYKFTS